METLNYNGLVTYNKGIKNEIKNGFSMKIASLDKSGNLIQNNIVQLGQDGGVFIDETTIQPYIKSVIGDLFKEFYIPVTQNIYLRNSWNLNADSSYNFTDTIEITLTTPCTDFDYLDIYGLTDDGFKLYIKIISPKVGETFSMYNIFHNGGNIFFKARTFKIESATKIISEQKAWSPYDYMAGQYYTNGSTYKFAGVTNPASSSAEQFRIAISRIDGIKQLNNL